MEIIGGIIAIIFGFSVWAILQKVGALKGTSQDLTDQSTDRALRVTTAGLNTLERVIDSLENRILQQERDYNEDLDRLRKRYEQDTQLLKDEVKSLRELMVLNASKLEKYEAILRKNNLLPND